LVSYNLGMALPKRVPVKVHSEAAGYISSSPVVQRDLPIEELMEALVAVAGKNVERIVQLLRTGTIALGESRYRWSGLEAARQEVEPLLAAFPDPWPGRAFEPDRCVYAIIRAGAETIDLPREQAAQRRPRTKATFWDALMRIARERAPAYEMYSYRQRADVYVMQPAAQEVERLREAADLLAMERVAERLCRLPIDKILLLVNR
jgi:hypothetical protein